MRFKKLELLGFKSFADATEIVFEPGVTAIVGPNGCGKCLAYSQQLFTADGQRWTIGSLVEKALQESPFVSKLDDGFYTRENPRALSVLSLNPQTLKFEPRPVAAFIKRTAPEFLLKIQTKSGRQVTATPYHPLFTLQHGQLHALRADEVQPGVRIATPRLFPVTPPDCQTGVEEILSAFSADDPIYIPYSNELRDFVLQFAESCGGLAGLAKATGLSVDSLRGIHSRQAIHVATAARLVKLRGRPWGEESPSVVLKSKGRGQLRIPRRINEALARFLGYLISEGRSTASNQIRFVNGDLAIVDDFCKSAQEAFGLEAKVFSYEQGVKDVLIFSRALCVALQRLYDFPINSRSAEKRIPRRIMAASKGVAAEFLSALFEGDAYLSVRGSLQYVEYATASEQLARDLVTLLLRFGVTALCRPKIEYASNTQNRTKRPYYSVYIYGVENLKTLAGVLRFVGAKQEALTRFAKANRQPNHNLDLIPGLTPVIRNLTKTSGLRVKALRSESPRLAAYSEGRCEVSRMGVAQIVDLARQYGTQTTQTEAILQHLRRLAESDLYWDEIVAVEQVPPEGPWVYDLSIAETHNFVAENIVVHNSNIADAIKWVLGEQSARELRGGRMEDLIFNGSDRREPIHYAEVSLTLDNSDKHFPIDYSEITIARRLFRSGESEYLLNKTAVRMKEIAELLMGTGIGTSAYSLFEQGRIEQIINAHPEDRRVIFEEAAGITKFKTQKREALRRLDETEENLIRLADLIGEVKRQIQAIERQVRRAKAYRESYDRLKQLEVALARHEEDRLQSRWQAKEESLAQGRSQLKELEGLLALQESQLQQVRDAVAEADLRLGEAREALLTLTHRQESSKTALEMNRQRLAEAQNQESQLRQELEVGRDQIAQLEKQRLELAQRIAQEDAQRQSKEQQRILCQQRLEECARTIDQAEEAIVQAKERLLAATGDEVQVKNGFNRLHQELSRVEARDNRLKLEKAKVEAEKTQAVTELESLQKELANAQTQMQQICAQKRQGQEGLAAVEEHLETSRRRLYDLEQQATRLSSQLELLKSLMSSHEGYAAGVKALLTALDEGRLSRQGIDGVLAELMEVDLADAAAVDAALGSWSQAVVVESMEVALACRRMLEETAAGQVLFLIRNRVPLDPPASSNLLDRIGVPPPLEPLIKFLLSDTWLVADPEVAQEAAKRKDAPSRFVTPTGQMWTVAGALLGPPPAPERLIVGRVSCLRSLEGVLAQTHAEREKAQQEMELLLKEQQTQTQALSDLEAAFQERLESCRRLESAVESARTGVEKLSEEERLLELEQTESATQWEELKAQLHQWEGQLQAKEQAREELEALIRRWQEEMSGAKSIREESSVALATAKTELMSFDEIAASRRTSLGMLEEALGNTQLQMETRLSQLERVGLVQNQCQAAEQELELSLKELVEEYAQAEIQVEGAQKEKEAALEAQRSQERQWQALSRKGEELQSQLHAQQMEQAQLMFERKQIANRLLQVYQVSLEEPSAPVPSLSSQEELHRVRDEVQALSQKLQRMGPVNLGSIDEERELQERYMHLTTQQSDLLKAKADLHEAIAKINRTTRAMFRETFEAIQKEFQATFTQLFQGGQARLVLMDEEDILESGIEIIARPPGKPLQAITLLSGGEKALTSIALLFAIFRVKPSPFCLLDEIDAPLDEANIDRFTLALKEFLKESQFIIVTHNKKTMTMADVLYGITMQESGVSKIVSVKFRDQMNGNGDPTKGDSPQVQPESEISTSAEG